MLKATLSEASLKIGAAIKTGTVSGTDDWDVFMEPWKEQRVDLARVTPPVKFHVVSLSFLNISTAVTSRRLLLEKSGGKFSGLPAQADALRASKVAIDGVVPVLDKIIQDLAPGEERKRALASAVPSKFHFLKRRLYLSQGPVSKSGNAV